MALASDGVLDTEDAELVNIVLLADRMKWTLEYIESMDIVKYRQLQAILSASDRAFEFRSKRRGGE